MITLHKLLKKVNVLPPISLVDPEIYDISFNSKNVEKGSLFLGLPGIHVDGGIYWQDAIKNGAEAVIISRNVEKEIGKINNKKVLVLQEPLDYVYGQIISEFCGRPSRKLKLIGVTGTNGKTTIAFLLEYLLKRLGRKVALFGTLFNRWPGFSESASLTTDFADKLQPKLQRALEAKAEYAIMEVSSHAIAQKRISGCEFVANIFSNLSQDHLDYHKNMQKYFETKMELFKSPYISQDQYFSVINVDNDWGIKLFNALKSSCSLISINKTSNKSKSKNYFYVTKKEFTTSGSYCLLHTPTEEIELFIPLVGEFNLMNSLQVIITLYNFGFNLKDIRNEIRNFPGIPGRMEKIKICPKNSLNVLPEVFIDYAHTPDGLKNVLESLRTFSKGKRIVTVFGCGGDRDTEKRPIMGEIAEKLSDYVFITSDNPRTENPYKIIDQILAGITNKGKLNICVDRYKAIKKAISFGGQDDIVLIAGKGHENYQILKEKTIDFDDKKIAKNFLLDKLNSYA
tara:strand:- start:295 stop:1830 length:1536 start_codon:yes stop_codon:yes gene_type:complete